MAGPPELHARILAARARREADLQVARRREAAWRRTGSLALALLFCGLIVASHAAGVLGAAAILFGGTFLLGAIILLRERATAGRLRAEAAWAFHEQACAAREGRPWPRRRGEPAPPPGDHPFAQDLDLFGEGGLWSRLDRSATILGQDRLRALLLDPGSGPASDRQATVRDLAGRLELREALDLDFLVAMGLGAVPGQVEAGDASLRALAAWGEETPKRPAPLQRALMWIPSLAGPASLVLAASGFLPWSAFALVYAINFWWVAREREAERLEGALADLARALPGLAAAAARLAGERFPEGPLADAAARLGSPGAGAARALRELHRLSERLSARRNKFWQLTAGVLLALDPHLVLAATRWRRRHGSGLGSWLEALAEAEAHLSLAAHAAAVPEPVWPVFTDGGPVFQAADLSHPLLDPATRVGNDLALPEPGTIWLVTGSNLSGKSTFLRSAGLALLQARLGLPVAARSLTLRESALFTTMRVADDLRRGQSHFQAEVLRLAQGLALAARTRPLLVLLDEILSGTNSRERHAGAVAVIRAFRERGATLLVSTHDLELHASLAACGIPHRIVHFRDREVDGRMVFDYRLEPGLLPSTNALRVLRAAGIEVTEEDADRAV
jgi:hypothetical protein